MPDNLIHDTGFNLNEWYSIAMVVLGGLGILLLPKRFTALQTLYLLLIGIALALLFDHTLSLPPIDLYDVGDQSAYEAFDVVSYAMYAPAGYYFIYFYDRFQLKGFPLIAYLIAWIVIAILVEWVGALVGVFHYRNGYKFEYSTVFYPFLLSFHLVLFKTIFERKRNPARAQR